MKIGVLREPAAGERRVAIVPETVKKLAAKKLEVVVEAGAGKGAFVADREYEVAGARVLGSAAGVFSEADAVVRIHGPAPGEAAALREGAAWLSLLYPLSSPGPVRELNARKATVIALDMIPRTTLAQSMDVLSSQANIAGYWAVVAAATRLPKYFPMLMTAAGTIVPARVLVMGAGVAGLQAIATARRLGAVVEATDVRPETKEQVESLGAKFLEVTGVEVRAGQGGYAGEQSGEYQRRQAEIVAAAIQRADVVITTALVPGRKAPTLVARAQVASMRPGSVIVDLAAAQGGNVEGCVPGEDVSLDGVLVLAPTNAPSALAVHASLSFSRNLEKLLLHITKDGAWRLDASDEIVRGCLVARDGAVVHPGVKESLG
ncbi:MAG: Re/Si-specific NAD(P)(+) transhydrogenase subunit alpha [Planctomycetes bacterium]|nr:Re/Si-specific NAD(P)(+) transhydrogenase subunit alpha [Planctomycetota bacterium]